MNKQEQIEFVNELIENYRKTIVNNIAGDAPDNWDGCELRQYIGDYFAADKTKMSRSRMKAYKNTVLISGIL